MNHRCTIFILINSFFPLFLFSSSSLLQEEMYAKEVQSFLNKHASKLLKKNRQGLQQFISQREEQVSKMKNNSLAYKSIIDDNFPYEFTKEQCFLILKYKIWLFEKTNHSFMCLGTQEKENLDFLKYRLQEYKRRRFGDKLIVIECDEEFAYHRHMQVALRSYKSGCFYL